MRLNERKKFGFVIANNIDFVGLCKFERPQDFNDDISTAWGKR